MTKQPHYRLVAIDKREARHAAELEVLGFYDPKNKDNAITINNERVKYWLTCGAQPTETVKTLLDRTGFGKPETAAPTPS